MSELAGCLSVRRDAEICKKCLRADSSMSPVKFKIKEAKVHDYECDGYVNKDNPPLEFK